MKSLAALLTALLASFSALSLMAADRGIQINYSTSTSATYADGTPILEGERFLLVWFDKGVDIDLATDITGDEDSFLGDDWWWVSYNGAVGGVCPSCTWGMSEVADFYELYPQGRVQLYLLDTRISATELAPMVENSEGDPFPAVINAVSPISGATYSWNDYDYNLHTISGAGPIDKTSWTVYKTVPTGTPNPVVSAFVCVNGLVTVNATNTVATASYVLKKATDVAFENVVWTSASQSGAATKTTPLVFEDANATNAAAFYRVETAQ